MPPSVEIAVIFNLDFPWLKFSSTVLNVHSSCSLRMIVVYQHLKSGAPRTEPEVATCMLWSELVSPADRPPGLTTHISFLPFQVGFKDKTHAHPFCLFFKCSRGSRIINWALLVALGSPSVNPRSHSISSLDIGPNPQWGLRKADGWVSPEA